jgi:hypothetical protein
MIASPVLYMSRAARSFSAASSGVESGIESNDITPFVGFPGTKRPRKLCADRSPDMDLGRLRHLLLIAALVANRCSTQAQTRLPGDPAPAALPTAADWVLVVRATGGIAGIDHHATIDSPGRSRARDFDFDAPSNRERSRSNA